jgi:hypothetical protein
MSTVLFIAFAFLVLWLLALAVFHTGVAAHVLLAVAVIVMAAYAVKEGTTHVPS